MAAELVWRPGTTKADQLRVAAELQAVLDRRSDHGRIPAGIGPMRKSQIERDPEWIAYKKDFDAHFYYRHYSSFADVAGEVFIGATGLAVGGATALSVAGSGALAGAGGTLSSAGSSVASAVESTVASVQAGIGSLGAAGGVGGVVATAKTVIGVVQKGKDLASTVKNALSGSPKSAYVPTVDPGTPEKSSGPSAVVPIAVALVLVFLAFRGRRS